VPVGRALLAKRLPQILEDADNMLSVRLRRLLQRLRSRLRSLDTEVNELTELLRENAVESELCRRAITVPGVGPIVSTALVAAVNNARAFARGRDMAAWLGLVPRRKSTGARLHWGASASAATHTLDSCSFRGRRLYTPI